MSSRNGHVSMGHVNLPIVAIAVLLCVLSVTPVRADDTDGQMNAIRLHNMASVLLVHAWLKSSNGTSAGDEYGTGFIITTTGYVLTANHVLPVRTPDTELVIEGFLASNPPLSLALHYIKNDTDLDLVLLQLGDPGANPWIPVTFGDADGVPDQATLYALGFPMKTFSPSWGALRNRYGPNGSPDWLTSLNINHGDSGGPVFDIQGHVVAISDSGVDGGNGLTMVIPENLSRGLRALAGSGTLPPRPAVVSPDATSTTQTFNFYQSAPSEVTVLQDRSEQFCLPEGYTVQGVSSRVTTQNGPSKLNSVKKSTDKPNCVDVSASLAGLGVDMIGPVVVNHRGSGWLGAEINVTGRKD